MAGPKPYLIDFCNAAPDLMEVRNVATLDVDGVDVPADAMQFSLFDRDRVWVGPAYFATNDVEFGGLEDMTARHPNAIVHEPPGEFDRSAPYGLVTWDHPEGPQWSGSMLVPVIEGITAIYDRNRRVVASAPRE